MWTPPPQWLGPGSPTTLVGPRRPNWDNLTQVAGLVKGYLMRARGERTMERREGLTLHDVRLSVNLCLAVWTLSLCALSYASCFVGVPCLLCLFCLLCLLYLVSCLVSVHSLGPSLGLEDAGIWA